MSQIEASRRSRRFRTLLIVLITAMIVALTLYRISQEDDTTGEPAPSPSNVPQETPTQPPAVCRADGEFVAGFMSPQANDHETIAVLETMNVDAVTFGGRIEPVETSQYPKEVAEAIRDRQAYEYTVAMNWQGLELAETDTTVRVGDTEYGLIHAGDGVVVTESIHGADVFHSLTRTSADRENNAFIGLPVPQMRPSGETWLPDNSYADVVDGFGEKFVAAYHHRGADGFYLAMEMPLTDAGHWSPVTDYYERQTDIINDVSEGATVLISPYLEGRKDRETITPAVAAKGYEKLLGLANGTRVLVSPQDGLGVGTTALKADESQDHHYTVEDYFEVLHETEPSRLYVTIEAMSPGGETPDTRGKTTRDRVEDQLDATEPYVQGAIGFQWAGPNTMSDIPHIGDGACAAGPNQLQ